MNIRVVPKKKPQMKNFTMVCDVPIRKPKTICIDMLHRLNSASTLMVLGPPGSGKTTWVLQFLSSKDLMHGQFARIFIVSPPGSRASWNSKKNPLSRLPEERFFDEPSVPALEEIERQVREIAERNPDQPKDNKYFSCVVLDDVQDYMKDPEVVRYLKRFAMNRRHNYVFLILICQNYLALSKDVRQIINSIVCFGVSKEQQCDLAREYFLGKESDFFQLTRSIFTPDRKNSWLMMTRDGEIFNDWDQIVLGDEKEKDTEECPPQKK